MLPVKGNHKGEKQSDGRILLVPRTLAAPRLSHCAKGREIIARMMRDVNDRQAMQRTGRVEILAYLRNVRKLLTFRKGWSKRLNET